MDKSTRTCSVAECDVPRHARGFCKKHYQRFLSTGDPAKPRTGNGRDRKSSIRLCAIGDCGRPRHAQGYCNRHYKRLSITGDPMCTPSGMTHDKPAVCSVDGCVGGVRNRELCAKHYARKLKWGSAEHPVSERTASNIGRSNCSRCGEPLAQAGAFRKCVRCARELHAATESRRRAQKMDALCGHGPDCVTASEVGLIMSSPCVYCGAAAEHLDHLFPLARRGLHCRDNLVPACATCNVRKRAMDPFDWLLMLSAEREPQA